MAIREPKIKEVPNWETISQPSQWHTLKCELVTPMYGGGVDAATVDTKMPIRASAIRGQLRFWWRLLAKNKWNLGNTQAIQNAEFALWGGQGDSESASLVFIRIKNVKGIRKERWAEYRPNQKGRDVLYPENWANVPYALFPAQGRTQENPQEEPHELLREGLNWDLEISFSPQMNAKQEKQVWNTIKWWASFGGIGARTRRGLGAVKVVSEQILPVTTTEVQEIGGRITLRASSNPNAAWVNAVNRLQSFRQIGAGRRSYDTRSRWSEPDAIRFYTNQSLPRHAIRLTQGNIFPRAAFGLPMIFKFKDGGDTSRTDPVTTTLNVKRQTAQNQFELLRLSSPLILRPYLDERGAWSSLALCLPDNLYEILQRDGSLKLMLDEHEVIHWDKDQATDINPLQHNQETLDPLTAFLNYF